MSRLKYVRVMPASKTARDTKDSRRARIVYGLGLLAALAGFMLAAYIVAYTVARINGWCLG